MLNHALKYHAAGLKVVPVFKSEKDDRIKFGFAWKKYTKSQTAEEVKQIFSNNSISDNGETLPLWGLGILCTDGMEVIDIDTKADPQRMIHKQYFDEVFWGGTIDDEILNKCTTVKTKSGGYHLIYKTNKQEGNQKLCFRAESNEAVIETRGNGGLIFAYPTPGYRVMRGSYEGINTISDEYRDILINSAKRLSEIEIIETPKNVKDEFTPKIESNEDLTPWDDFNNQTDVRNIIESHGWTYLRENAEYAYYNRPDSKTKGNVHGYVVISKNIFSSFTTSTEFEAGKGYTAFGALTMLEHSGDFSACARELMKNGYGRSKVVELKKEEKEAQKNELFDFIKSTKFDIHNPPQEEEATLTLDVNGKTYKVGGNGMIGAAVGKQKSGKSFISSVITASSLSGRKKLGFHLKSQGKRKIYIDTEQSKFFYGETQKRLYKMSGLVDNPTTYEAYHLRRLSVQKRVEAIDLILAQPGEIELIVIDGLVDLCPDFNEVKASEETMGHLLRWSDTTGAMIITVLHTTKAMGFMRGHLGTALQNKCDFAFEVSKDPEMNHYKVKCRESRFAPHPTFEFSRDDNGLPYIEGEEGEQIEDDSLFEPQNKDEVYDPIISKSRGMDDDSDIPF